MKKEIFISQFEEDPAVSVKINSEYDEELQMRDYPRNSGGTVTTVETDTHGEGDTDTDQDAD